MHVARTKGATKIHTSEETRTTASENVLKENMVKLEWWVDMVEWEGFFGIFYFLFFIFYFLFFIFYL